ncbi:transcriptional regulator [Sphingomonas sp. SM33]|uniref:Transcriptional regulator n=1 Tax=Sphingomonas telluris TaxID=2907998 RepID=A0ABS9VNB0_9SPHN|nr:transcriptional regulator [Sphingomonas telluris]MCH8616462.1 transcriptional regulator [Sphingomonas telluris]
MSSGSFRFEAFSLDPQDRQLRRGSETVELNGRYLDALALLVSEQGRLVPKTRFMDEIWRGVPVTDEALTQCIRTLRKQLGDDAGNPRFIETVPKHGYRFIAPVERVEGQGSRPIAVADASSEEFVRLGLAGTTGGLIAGAVGGLFYGLAGNSEGMGTLSVLLVLLTITTTVATIGATGVSFGIAAARRVTRRPWQWAIIGGAFGGLVVGGIVKLLGSDASNLFLGQAPGDITGPAEGGVLGAAVGLAAWLTIWRAGRPRLRRGAGIGAVTGGFAGLVIALLGRPMMGGSLERLAQSFPHSRLRIDQVGHLFGESGFGPVTQTVTSMLEGALFGACVVGAMIVAERGSKRAR